MTFWSEQIKNAIAFFIFLQFYVYLKVFFLAEMILKIKFIFLFHSECLLI